MPPQWLPFEKEIHEMEDLLRACLALLELPARERVWRPTSPPLWRVPDALAHMRALLAGQPQGAALATFLPVVVGLRGSHICGTICSIRNQSCITGKVRNRTSLETA